MVIYRPALRFKEGEYTALSSLRADIRAQIIPYFVVPPLRERDPEKGRSLNADEIAYVVGDRIGRHWPILPAYIDVQHVLNDLDDVGLQKLHRQAAQRNSQLIPVVPIGEVGSPVWKSLIRETYPRAAIHISHEDLDDELLIEGLKSLGVAAKDCELFVDFTGAELRPDLATESVAGIIAGLSELAPWGCIIFQASSFPSKNPADAGGECSIPRHEWSIFSGMALTSGIPTARIGFSDFGADSGAISFPKKPSGGRPIPHVRYTTATDTVVIRGASEGEYSPVMRQVLKRLVRHPEFAGETYSVADRELVRAANGYSSVGNATTWRRWNMAHHFVRVVRDLGSLFGVEFPHDARLEIHSQRRLFESMNNGD
ncbi:beta family protein [Maricaulis sp.]|uniref:beta family protein n=1 Tax=Maricaulis sp. TaxID=1486257 RepID=UPI003A95591A